MPFQRGDWTFWSIEEAYDGRSDDDTTLVLETRFQIEILCADADADEAHGQFNEFWSRLRATYPAGADGSHPNLWPGVRRRSDRVKSHIEMSFNCPEHGARRGLLQEFYDFNAYLVERYSADVTCYRLDRLLPHAEALIEHEPLPNRANVITLLTIGKGRASAAWISRGDDGHSRLFVRDRETGEISNLSNKAVCAGGSVLPETE